GGDYLSQNLNLYSGTGTITGHVDQVTGQLNTNAGIEHFSADSSALTLGDNKILNDPTFINNGDIFINGLNSFGEDVTFIANGNISAGTTGAIAAPGHDITLLSGVFASTNGTTTTVDFSSPLNAGGNIDFSLTTYPYQFLSTSSTTGNGGNITI